jgi:hypothetical protein
MAKTSNNTESTKKVYVSNRPAISMSELKKRFPYISQKELDWEVSHNEWIKLDKFLAHVAKINDGHRLLAERPDVKRLTINIEWKASRTWGHNPHAYCHCLFADGTDKSGHSTCGGCGYDKESTVVAEIFNQVLSGTLWRKRNSKKATPYGIYRGKDWYFPRFEGGVGINCYYSITSFLGGKMKRTATGKSFDSYEITF